MGLSVGIPAGRGCSVASVVSATPGTSAHVNIVVAGGIYCARIDDLGNLGAPASFEINITHTQ